MENNNPKETVQPFLTKVLDATEGEQLRTILVKIFAPTKDKAIYNCSYEIWIERELVRVSTVTGGDHAYPLSSGAILCNMSANTELGHDAAYP